MNRKFSPLGFTLQQTNRPKRNHISRKNESHISKEMNNLYAFGKCRLSDSTLSDFRRKCWLPVYFPCSRIMHVITLMSSFLRSCAFLDTFRFSNSRLIFPAICVLNSHYTRDTLQPRLYKHVSLSFPVLFHFCIHFTN